MATWGRKREDLVVQDCARVCKVLVVRQYHNTIDRRGPRAALPTFAHAVQTVGECARALSVCCVYVLSPSLHSAHLNPILLRKLAK